MASMHACHHHAPRLFGTSLHSAMTRRATRRWTASSPFSSSSPQRVRPFTCTSRATQSPQPTSSSQSRTEPEDIAAAPSYDPIGLLGQPKARIGEPPLMEKLSDGSYFFIHEREAPPLPNDALPPVLPRHEDVAAQTGRKYHLNEDHFAEMARLRNEDPALWTVSRLARHFDCSPLVVSKYAPCPPEQKAAIADAWQETWEKSGKVWKAKIMRRQMIRQKEQW